MGWFNYLGLFVMAIMLLPNIVYAVKHKNGVKSTYRNRAAEAFEQIGRYGCFTFMIFNIPYTYFNFWFEYAFWVYLSGNCILLLAYLIFWFVCRNQNGRFRALSLSILPSCIFLFSGVMLLNIPLIAFAVIFAVCHILISYKNATVTNREE